MAEPLRPLLLCADDFGLSPGIDAAIAELVHHGRLGAFTCMTNLPRWREAGTQVAALRVQALAGLHLNLTEGAPVSASLARHWPVLPALPRLILAAHLGLLPLTAIGDEVDCQWQALVDRAGVAPDFLDGHQHVHHLPGVRDLVLDRAATAGIPLRSTGRVAGPGDALKRALIERTGGRALARQARRRQVRHNAVLLGAYGFDGDYRARMRRWLTAVPVQGALLFCHPGRPAATFDADALPDPIAPARQREYAYLGSDDFFRDLAESGVALSRRWPLAE